MFEHLPAIPSAGLPGLVERAASALANARTSAEILEAREKAGIAYDAAKRAGRLAKAKAAHDELIAAIHRTQADALEIEAAAKRRLADEYDAAQERGEVATRGGERSGREHSTPAPSAADIGLSRKDIHEARQLRDAENADPGVIRRTLDERIERGEEPTKAAIREAIKPTWQPSDIVEPADAPDWVVAPEVDEETPQDSSANRRTTGASDNQWFTPSQHIEIARSVLGEIDLDPATHEEAQKNVRAQRFFTEADNGLSQEWHGRVWLNPPYSQPSISHFVEKMMSEYAAGRVSEGIMLTHNCTDTAWFHSAVRASSAICLTRGRIRFIALRDSSLMSPPQGQTFFYFGSRKQAFADAFASVGLIMEMSK